VGLRSAGKGWSFAAVASRSDTVRRDKYCVDVSGNSNSSIEICTQSQTQTQTQTQTHTDTQTHRTSRADPAKLQLPRCAARPGECRLLARCERGEHEHGQWWQYILARE
jgi:hypothetical protein